MNPYNMIITGNIEVVRLMSTARVTFRLGGGGVQRRGWILFPCFLAASHELPAFSYQLFPFKQKRQDHC